MRKTSLHTESRTESPGQGAFPEEGTNLNGAKAGKDIEAGPRDIEKDQGVAGGEILEADTPGVDLVVIIDILEVDQEVVITGVERNHL